MGKVTSEMSLSGHHAVIMTSYTLAEIACPDSHFLQRVEAAFTKAGVGHVYLSAHAGATLAPYISILHQNRVPFTIVDVQDQHTEIAIEVVCKSSHHCT